MSKCFFSKTAVTLSLFLFAAGSLSAQTPPPRQDEIKLQGIVFEGETSADAVAVINGESFKAGATITHFRILQIERDFIVVEDLNTQEQFQYGILGDKKLVRAKPADPPKPKKGPLDFLFGLFGGNPPK